MHHNFSTRYHHVSSTRPHPGGSFLRLHEQMAEIVRKRSGAYDESLELVRLPSDPHVLIEAKAVAERYYSSRLKYIVLIGIGGQSLGINAVYDALRGTLNVASEHFPKIIFLDTVSATLLHDLEHLMLRDVASPDEILIVVSSKSGTTTETLVNAELFLARMHRLFPEINDRVVVLSNPSSPLFAEVQRRGFGTLSLREHVGGRYSIFSVDGILSLLLAGIDVVEFLKGAQYMNEKNFGPDPESHYARHSAEAIFGAMHAGARILNIFHFHPELETLGKWERQLVAESLGKLHDRSGKVVHAGITPIVTIGSTDLHSMAQLYFGGPRDKFTMLIRAHTPSSLRVPAHARLGSIIPAIAGKSPDDIMDAIYRGVLASYRHHELPHVDVSLPALSAFSIGLYMQWRILATIYLAELMHVHAFDQPAVEHYKKETRKFLGG